MSYKVAKVGLVTGRPYDHINSHVNDVELIPDPQHQRPHLWDKLVEVVVGIVTRVLASSVPGTEENIQQKIC